MAARLIYIDCSAVAVPLCRCGWRGSAAVDVDEARRAGDRHRAAVHPGAAVDAARQRRHRVAS